MNEHTVPHGALDYAELAGLGLQPGQICDFSSNINPFGPPAAVHNALAALNPAPYPDRSCYQLRLMLAQHHACSPDAILAGNGSNELIHLLGRALLAPGDCALVIEPTFGEYAHAVRLSAGHVISWRAEEPHFRIDIAAVCAVILRQRPRLVWLCAPNNPTGTLLDENELALLTSCCLSVNGWLVLDQTYAAFVRAPHPEIDQLNRVESSRVLRLHSLTKSYALAGLRIGYLLADPLLIKRIATYQPTWSVSSAAQAASLAALTEHDFLPSSMARLWECSDALQAGLAALGLPVMRHELPFLLVRTGNGAETRAALLQRSCAVRDCASFGLPSYVRVAPGAPDSNRRLIDEWAGYLRDCPSAGMIL